MRLMFILLSALVLSQCATGEDQRFHAGTSPDSLVIIGVAETESNRAPVYTMLWRRIDENDRFLELDGATSFEARTNAGGTIRIRGIPGEFAVLRVQPGVYALDGAFAQLREGGLMYFAQGVVEGPSRPTFVVGSGEAVYVGIWEMDIQGANAVTRMWRLDAADRDAVVRVARSVAGPVRMRETHLREVPCQPHAMNPMTQRQVC